MLRPLVRYLRPSLEQLEARYALATFFVTHAGDSGPGSLRQALLDANALLGADRIHFRIVGSTTISPATPLPTVTDPLTIDGTTQPGFKGLPGVVLDGSNAGANANGLLITGGNTTVRGLAIHSFASGRGIRLETNGNNVIVGNYLGLGTRNLVEPCDPLRGSESRCGAPAPVGNRTGVYVLNSSNNRIGGTRPQDRNVISGNDQSGVFVTGSSTGNAVLGNYIGTTTNGLGAKGNNHGVQISGANGNTVGGPNPAARNIISGNANVGVFLNNGSQNNNVQGNYIGTARNGLDAVANGYSGVTISTGASNNVIGGTTAETRNLISGNAGDGINIFDVTSTNNLIVGNYVGTDAAGTLDLGNGGRGVGIYDAPANRIGGTTAGSGNVISGNSSDGIAVFGVPAAGNTIEGNLIGTDKNGVARLGNSFQGIVVTDAVNTRIGGTSSTARNVISGNLGIGVFLNTFGAGGATGTVIQGNYIGTNAAGTAALGNTLDGVSIASSPNNTVGGTVAGARNIISGNGGGIGIVDINSSGNMVQGNYIGTDVTGTARIGNGYSGLYIHRASNNTIGGTLPLARNVISGNAVVGVSIHDNATSNQVVGNFIGSDATGTVDLGNGHSGVSISLSSNNNILGGTTASARNVISGNDVVGVAIAGNSSANLVQGNYIGTDVSGSISLGNGASGVSISQASRNTIGGTLAGARNVISGNGTTGVEIHDQATLTLVQGNYIGTDALGTGALGNGYSGITVAGGVTQTTIGGSFDARNLISGNANDGISIFGAPTMGTLIQGNYIGTDVTGSLDLGNLARGVGIYDSSFHTVNNGNVISGNNSDGIAIFGGNATNNIVEQNYLGTNANATAAIANGFQGVAIADASSNAIRSNVISGNLGSGLLLFSFGGNGANNNSILNNHIGTSFLAGISIPNGFAGISIADNSSFNSVVGNRIAHNMSNGIEARPNAVANQFVGNSIYENGGLGIDLNVDGVTHNDPFDADSGANSLQNFPDFVLFSPTTAGFQILGTMNSVPNTDFQLEFFWSMGCDPSGHGEGQHQLTSFTVTTNSQGTIFPLYLWPVSLPYESGIYISGIAHGPNGTSEFSPCIQFDILERDHGPVLPETHTGAGSVPSAGPSGLPVQHPIIPVPIIKPAQWTSIDESTVVGDSHLLSAVTWNSTRKASSTIQQSVIARFAGPKVPFARRVAAPAIVDLAFTQDW